MCAFLENVESWKPLEPRKKKKKMTLLWIISLLLTPINVEIENPKVFFLTYFGTTKMNNTFSSECHVSCQ